MLAGFSRLCCPTLYNRAPWKELVLSILTPRCTGLVPRRSCTVYKKIVNFCARVVAGKRRHDHVSGTVTQLGWLTAKQLVAYHTVCAVERTIVSGQPESLLQTIGPRARQRHNHDTRRADLFTLPSIRVEAGRLLSWCVADERHER